MEAVIYNLGRYLELAHARSLGRHATFGFAKFFSPIPNRLKCPG